MILKNNYYILRHGLTKYQIENPTKIYPKDGVKKVSLSDEGISDLKKVSEKIKDFKIDKIYASDFLRTRQTAEVISKKIGLNLNNLIFTERLRDTNLGIWHGKSKEDFYKEFSMNLEGYQKKPEKGESLKEVEERMLSFILDIDKLNSNNNILIISHGDPLWLLQAKVNNISKEELFKEKSRKNGIIKTAEIRKL